MKINSDKTKVTQVRKRFIEYLNIRTLILIIIIAVIIEFTIGIIHPYAVLGFWSFSPLFFAFIFTILISSIIKFIRDLFGKEKMIFYNILKIVLSFILASIFGLSQNISFAGLRIHYFFVKDFDTIRAWANNIDISNGNLLYMNGVDIPKPAQPFHPENVKVIEREGQRELILSWNSGLMEFDLNLTICSPDVTYKPENGLFAKIQNGVYLDFCVGSK